jgi:hypothetical protein
MNDYDDADQRTGHSAARTGVNDHSWEREHRHPTAAQTRAIGDRRRVAEAKLEQHQQEAKRRAPE